MPAATLRIRLTPRADRSRIVREEGGVLHVRVTAPPVEGAANAALLALLADALDVRKTALTIRSGASGRDKTVQIDGLAESELRARLNKLFSPDHADEPR